MPHKIAVILKELDYMRYHKLRPGDHVTIRDLEPGPDSELQFGEVVELEDYHIVIEVELRSYFHDQPKSKRVRIPLLHKVIDLFPRDVPEAIDYLQRFAPNHSLLGGGGDG